MRACLLFVVGVGLRKWNEIPWTWYLIFLKQNSTGGWRRCCLRNHLDLDTLRKLGTVGKKSLVRFEWIHSFKLYMNTLIGNVLMIFLPCILNYLFVKVSKSHGWIHTCVDRNNHLKKLCLTLNKHLYNNTPPPAPTSGFVYKKKWKKRRSVKLSNGEIQNWLPLKIALKLCDGRLSHRTTSRKLRVNSSHPSLWLTPINKRKQEYISFESPRQVE